MLMVPLLTSGIIAAKIGRAKYEGAAAGKYVTRDTVAETSEIGIFTATAELVGRFRGALDAAADPAETLPRAPGNNGTIAGTISDFVLESGAANNWRVTLMPAGLSQIGDDFIDHDRDGSHAYCGGHLV